MLLYIIFVFNYLITPILKNQINKGICLVVYWSFTNFYLLEKKQNLPSRGWNSTQGWWEWLWETGDDLIGHIGAMSAFV
jgi:hypothetical protein